MKRLGWILVLLMVVAPAWADKKITVQQLKDLLVSVQQAKKADQDVATQLKQVELTEELTQSTMNSLATLLPGPLSTAQLFVLEARSAMLAPQATDLPSMPAPDAAAQKAILDKAVSYASTTYAQLPHLTATKTTTRFQDNLRPPGLADFNRLSSDVWSNPKLGVGGQYINYIGTTETKVENEHGVEIPSKVKDKTLWGQNGQIVLLGQGPILSNIVQEAQAAGKFNWLRWEMVSGLRTAVFSFTVDKKNSHYAVNYCCFLSAEIAGASGNRQGVSVSHQGISRGGLGIMQNDADWPAYKKTVPYHGEIFVESASGIIVRLVTFAEFKASDAVHQEDTRIDYGPAKVDGKQLILPVRTIIDTEVNPNGADTPDAHSVRLTLFTIEYKGYQSAGPAR